jgi:hypothetical protein
MDLVSLARLVMSEASLHAEGAWVAAGGLEQLDGGDLLRHGRRDFLEGAAG